MWASPILAQRFSPFLDPPVQRDRCVALQATRTRARKYTGDIWRDPQLGRWVSAEGPSLILLQGNSQSIDRLERFSIEITKHLERQCPVAYILSSFIELDEPNLLRQLAIQILQHVSLRDPAPFLVGIVSQFSAATGWQDWFVILKHVCSFLSNLSIIVDCGAIHHSSASEARWATQFQALCDGFGQRERKINLRVMLLGCRPFVLRSNTTTIISVEQVKPPPAFHRQLPSSDQYTLCESIPVCNSTCTAHEMNDLDNVSMRPKSTAHCDDEKTTRTTGGVVGKAAKETYSSRTAMDFMVRDRDYTFFANPLPKFPPESRRDIETAIICALTLEADAVEAVFDNYCDASSYGKLEGDTNAYSIGLIGRHCVVLVHMPSMGKSNAATVAANCRATFPEIRLALLVGICGGVPLVNGAEILLGDVVISEGIIQYDFGRQYADGFRRKSGPFDTTSKPTAEIRSLLSKVKGLRGHKRLKDRTRHHISVLQDRLGSWATYPGIAEDQLFEPTYRHKHRKPLACPGCVDIGGDVSRACELARISTCETLKCDPGRLIVRQRHAAINSQRVTRGQEVAQSLVHFGLFASGDRVMKSAEDRDKIAKSEGIIAFEMEGAGVWDTFPCLIIKGICDYSDSHKNKKWQRYAAVTAAACLKAFLEEWATHDKLYEAGETSITRGYVRSSISEQTASQSLT
ncbi:Nucleoside phosphorylase domain protein [Metarhizium album ARSEF 1941]|uniref:Nucleoside phosphorylase domain protein n=1 Tax=Metarhizium album (strain ARSEF 1941) TaxID=1081103 RepID=A0A0B2WJR8_METAS|nr:Nucleoside phosphorylase domain protein [Metarhizium album ARSEF 1941]KHN96246.1 Nucleoside phosphorylase domain protein [Metarhizium album ARSEF 1941]